jgi:arylsulfatase A-like enzyme
MLRIIAIVLCVVCGSAMLAEAPRPERHVVVVVWDGMRPDFVSKENTPSLWKLAQQGVIFRKHHAVYPSATMVNGTAMVTGVYPGKSGIIANHVYRPDIDPHHALDVELPPVVNKGDEISAGKYISFPTIAELVQRAGRRSVIAAAKTVGLLLDRHLGNGHAKNGVTLFAGTALPSSAFGPITASLGSFPSDHLQQDAWTTKALADALWKDDVPALSILWFGEPDLTEHESVPGAPRALAAIKSADKNLAAVLSALDQRKARKTTDLFVISDHGFSTIERSVDLPKILNDAGFAAKTEFKEEPKPGDIMLAGNGGSVLFYVIGHDEALIRRLVEFLQQSDFAGVIFTRQPMEGTFGLEQAMIEPPKAGSAPDLVMAFRWNDSKNQFGVRGMIDADWQRAAGKGTHATLSGFDMHNLLIAAGPDFKRDQVDDLPTGSIDLAPTTLRILGITPPHQMDGRVLSEAMVSSHVEATLRNGGLPGRRSLGEGGQSAEKALSQTPETNEIEATKDFPSGTWRQSLQISRVGSTIYLDEGNGDFQKRSKHE